MRDRARTGARHATAQLLRRTAFAQAAPFTRCPAAAASGRQCGLATEGSSAAGRIGPS